MDDKALLCMILHWWSITFCNKCYTYYFFYILICIFINKYCIGLKCLVSCVAFFSKYFLHYTNVFFPLLTRNRKESTVSSPHNSFRFCDSFYTLFFLPSPLVVIRDGLGRVRNPTCSCKDRERSNYL